MASKPSRLDRGSCRITIVSTRGYKLVTLLKENPCAIHHALFLFPLEQFLSSNSLVTHKQLSSLIQHRMIFVVSTAHDSRFACKIFLRWCLYHTLPIARSLEGGAGLYVWLAILGFQTGALQITWGGVLGRSSHCSSKRVSCTGHANNWSSAVV